MDHTFEIAFTRTLGVEGGYSNNPNDPGGATKFGITIAVARANGYKGDMKVLPLDKAKEIYKKNYWDSLKLDKFSPPLAIKLFDAGVNVGIKRVAQWLQTSLNALNSQQRFYSNIAVDGMIGPATINAYNSLAERRGSSANAILIKAINCLQGSYYLNLAENDSKFETFIYGWLSNRID